MAPKKEVSGTYTAAAFTDLYTNSGSTYAIALKISTYNPETTGKAVEIIVVDGSDVFQEELLNATIAMKALIADPGKTLIPPGHKIRFKSEINTTKFTAHMYEGVV